MTMFRSLHRRPIQEPGQTAQRSNFARKLQQVATRVKTAAYGPYRHKPLDLHRSQIRLFRPLSRQNGILTGEIAIRNFEDSFSYQAVSYMWGPLFPTREIIIKGRSFTVRENLWQFLCHYLDFEHGSGDSMYNSGDDWLWIDQICIDQNTVEERNHQVGLMSTIYARANRVLVWLGSEADGSREAIEAIKSGCDATRQHAGKVKALFERPYWSRLWIIQEVLMSRAVSVMCGNQYFGMEDLARMYVPDADDYLEGSPDEFYPVEINDTVDSLIRETSSGVFEKQKLSFILWSFAKLQCEDPRDKVYGLLSLVRGPEMIAVDYSKTPTEVFFDTIQRIVQDETVMAFDSHVDLAKYLRDSMSLGIETIDIEAYIRNEFRTTRDIRNEFKATREVEDNGHLDTMIQAARKGNTDRVRELLHDRRTGIETNDHQEWTPITWAIREDHRDIVELLVNDGEADLEAKDWMGRTPLYLAADWQRREVVEILLKSKRVRVREKNYWGNTALMRAASQGANDIVQLLLDADKSEGDGGTAYLSDALAMAAKAGHRETIQMILGTDGVDMDAKQLMLWRALQNAALYGKDEIAAMLLEDYGADVNARSSFGDTPLILAVEQSSEDVVRLLLRKENILVNAQNNDGLTALHAAATMEYLRIATLLLETGKADIEVKDCNGRTAMDIAEKRGHEELVQLLRAHSSVP